MNERIKELALQSQLVYETTDGKVYNSWEDYVDLTEYVEKLAELIVQKCAQIAKTVDGDESDDYKSGRTWAAIDVLKHFGVE